MPGIVVCVDRRAADEGWLATFPMWDWVGGRTSVFSAVGLLPAAANSSRRLRWVGPCGGSEEDDGRGLVGRGMARCGPSAGAGEEIGRAPGRVVPRPVWIKKRSRRLRLRVRPGR